MFWPAVTMAGPVLVTATSADTMTVFDTIAVLLPRLVSGVALGPVLATLARLLAVPVPAPAELVLVTARSAAVLTVVIDVAWLLTVLPSCVVELLTKTVLGMTVLLGVLGLTWTTKVKTAVLPGETLGLVAVT